MRNWLLPEYVEDILPDEALHIEIMRRQIIDLLFVHGYQLVIPPMLEYVESLLSGSGSDMDLRIFKVIDQLSGRMMGLRADMTPQVARIDAHLLNCEGITRLCYANSVLHTVPFGLTQTREPLQVGAELYGHSGLDSDLEVQRLMLQCLSIANVCNIHLDLGHVAVFRSLIKHADISRELETELFAILQAKDVSTLKEICLGLEKNTCEALMLLPELYGDKKVLVEAYKHLPDYSEIRVALDELSTIAEQLKAFGRARPATGFSMDLREISRLVNSGVYPKAIRAPFQGKSKALELKIEQLRHAGQIVVMELPGQKNESLDCDRQLVLDNGEWVVKEI